MKAVNLSKLIHEVWKDDRTRELRLRKNEVKILAEVFVDHIGKGLLKYGKVKLQGLFTLDIRQAKGRRINNPQTKEEMYSKDYYKIGITPSKKIKSGLKLFKKIITDTKGEIDNGFSNQIQIIIQ